MDSGLHAANPLSRVEEGIYLGGSGLRGSE